MPRSRLAARARCPYHGRLMRHATHRRHLPGPSAAVIARFALLTAAVWVAAHDLVYLAAHGVGGYRPALQASGHGGYWVAMGVAAVLGAGALATLALQRSHALARRLVQLGGLRVRPSSSARLVARIARLWLLLLVASLAIFIAQENLEHLTQHAGHVPGLEVLYGTEYHATLPIFAALALAAATIGSLAIERLRALAEAVARAERAPWPERRPRRPAPPDAPRVRDQRSAPDLGRAPPPLLAA
jgi:hypothetical protein